MDVEKVKGRAEAFLQENGVRGMFVALEMSPDQMVHETINEWVMARAGQNEYIDFICMTNHGANFDTHTGEKYLGSVANGLVRFTKVNILFIPARIVQ
jgi:nucleotide-binding universal stress UspA family protein